MRTSLTRHCETQSLPGSRAAEVEEGDNPLLIVTLSLPVTSTRRRETDFGATGCPYSRPDVSGPCSPKNSPSPGDVAATPGWTGFYSEQQRPSRNSGPLMATIFFSRVNTTAGFASLGCVSLIP